MSSQKQTVAVVAYIEPALDRAGATFDFSVSIADTLPVLRAWADHWNDRYPTRARAYAFPLEVPADAAWLDGLADEALESAAAGEHEDSVRTLILTQNPVFAVELANA